MIMKKESKPIYQRKFYGPSGEVYLSKRIFYILNSLEKFPLKNYPFSGTQNVICGYLLRDTS